MPSDHVGEQCRSRDDQHDAARLDTRSREDLQESLDAELASNKYPDKKGVHRCDRCRLGWREDATVNAAENNHRHKQSGDSPDERTTDNGQRGPSATGSWLYGFRAVSYTHLTLPTKRIV